MTNVRTSLNISYDLITFVLFFKTSINGSANTEFFASPMPSATSSFPPEVITSLVVLLFNLSRFLEVNFSTNLFPILPFAPVIKTFFPYCLARKRCMH